MPAIPILEQQTRLSGGLPVAQPNMHAMQPGNDVGAGLQAVGGTLQSIGAEQQAALKKQQDEEARVWAGQATSDLYLKQFQRMNDMKAQAAPGAPDFVPTFLKGFDEQIEAAATMAPNDASKRYLQMHAASMRQTLGQHALSFEASAQDADRTNRHADAIDNWAKVVQQDPGQFANAMQVLEQTRPAVGAQGQEKLADLARKSLTSAAASHMLDQDPYALKEATGKALGEGGATGATGVPWVDAASAEQVKQWNSAAQVKIHQIEGEVARDAAARDKLASDTLKEAFDLQDGGKYFSPMYQEKLLGATRGTQYAAQAEQLIHDQAQTAGFASAPASQRTATITSMAAPGADPTKGTDPISVKALAGLQRIDAAIRTAVKDNPWTAAPQYGIRGIDGTQFPITSLQDVVGVVQKRAAQIGQLEQWTGQPESLLQPQEAEQTARLLRTLPPDQAASVLGQIGSAIGNPGRIGALAGQISKTDKGIELAMLLAGDKTTAGRNVSELVLRGQQALADKTVKRDDAALTGWKSEIATLVNGTLGNPQDEQRVKDAAYYVRAAMDDAGSQAPGYQLRSGAADAVTLVVGAPIERGGVKTLLPRGMKEDEFDAALKRYTPEVLQSIVPGGKIYWGGKEVQPAYLAGRITSLPIQRFSAGGYAPLNNGRPFTVDAAGTQPLVLKVQ